MKHTYYISEIVAHVNAREGLECAFFTTVIAKHNPKEVFIAFKGEVKGVQYGRFNVGAQTWREVHEKLIGNIPDDDTLRTMPMHSSHNM